MPGRILMVGVVGVGRVRDPEIVHDADNTLGEGIEVGSTGVVPVETEAAGNGRKLCTGEWLIGSVIFKVK
jgi:hypothetical protein